MNISRIKIGSDKNPLQGSQLENELGQAINAFNFHDSGTAGWNNVNVVDGANKRMGTAVLVGGTKTVNNTSVTANTRIFLTNNASAGTPGFLYISARVASTSFTITSSNGADTSTIAWFLVEPK